MDRLFWLSTSQFKRIKPYFPLSHGVPSVDDMRVVSGIIYVIRNGLQWKDAPGNTDRTRRCITVSSAWSGLGIFNRIFAELAGKAGMPDRLMIDATHLKAHRTAVSLLKKRMYPAVSVARRAA
jgi:putative transposase